MTRARSVLRYDRKASAFYCQLLDHEGNYKKMLEVVSDPVPYSTLLTYAGKLIFTDKSKFITALFQRSDDYSLRDTTSDEELEQVTDLLKKHYSSYEIRQSMRMYVDRHWHGRGNLLIDYVQE